MNKFVDELTSLNICDKLDKQLTSDPNNNYGILSGLLKYAREKHVPKKTVKYQKKRHKKSKWISNGILNSINTKDKLYKVLIQTDPANTILYERRKKEFKQYRAELRKSIRKAKCDYYTSIFNRHENDTRKMWGLLNETLNRNIRKQSTHEFLLNNKTTSDPEVIANEFNQYFANIGIKLAENIPAAPHFDSYLNNPAETVFSFNLTSEHNISNVIKKLKNKSSYGCKCRPTASNYSRHCPFGYVLFYPAFGAIYRYGVHRTLGSWRKKYSSQDMTYYFLSFHSSVIFYCFSRLNRRLKVNLRYYSIDLLFKLSKSDSANLDKLFCCALLA